MAADGSQQAGVRRTVIRSVAALLGMFAFAFALVPLYDVFCRVTGLNGKVDTTAKAIIHEEVDQSRFITVQFITRGSAGLPWQMSVETRQMRVHPGQTYGAPTPERTAAQWLQWHKPSRRSQIRAYEQM